MPDALNPGGRAFQKHLTLDPPVVSPQPGCSLLVASRLDQRCDPSALWQDAGPTRVTALGSPRAAPGSRWPRLR